ncbi:hypothetical protein JXB22_02025 [candidate division WOR-3 bacterium]|nr:hypothetical protein [candidate division WOR-3 bacterium]
MNLCVILALFSIYSHPDSLIRGVYINCYQASKQEYLDVIFEKADSNMINAIVVDLKSDYGFLCYDSKNTIARELGAIKRFVKVDYILEQAAKRGIKVIARIVCFKDDYLSAYENYAIYNDSNEVWRDYKDLAWTNPYKKEVRDYLVDVSKEIVDLGFTSLTFDYLRFPTDGPVDRMKLTNVYGSRCDPLHDLLKAVRHAVGDTIEIGACVFGFTVLHALKAEGQDIARMSEYVDVFYPMLYPSHFNASYKKGDTEYWRNYWIYYDAIYQAAEKVRPGVKIVPFVQGFDYRTEQFDETYVFAQINGALSAYADGIVIWHAGGDYATSWPSLLWARNSSLRRSAQMSLNTRMREAGQLYQGKSLLPSTPLSTPQAKSLTMAQLSSQPEPYRCLSSDTLPSRQSRRFYLDPVSP